MKFEHMRVAAQPADRLLDREELSRHYLGAWL